MPKVLRGSLLGWFDYLLDSKLAILANEKCFLFLIFCYCEGLTRLIYSKNSNFLSFLSSFSLASGLLMFALCEVSLFLWFGCCIDLKISDSAKTTSFQFLRWNCADSSKALVFLLLQAKAFELILFCQGWVFLGLHFFHLVYDIQQGLLASQAAQQKLFCHRFRPAWW